MRNRDLKLAAISAFGPGSDFSKLGIFREISRREEQRLLRWLDESGLAIYFLDSLERHGALDCITTTLQKSLRTRLNANKLRTKDSFCELHRVMAALREKGARFCVLKGLSLTPDFCRAPFLRHQTDLDFLIAPESLDSATAALKSCGYSWQEGTAPGELTFATPLEHVPSPDDDIYATPRHREVDLRTAMREISHGVSINAADDYLDRVKWRTLEGVSFPSLPEDDLFVLQVTHAFKHLLGSWVRLSWLYEIATFIDAHYDDRFLWTSIRDRAPHEKSLRDAFGLILRLTKKVFARPIPRALAQWCVDGLPSRMETWANRFGTEVALADLAGSKLTLIVHREFVTEPAFWTPYLLHRIFPVRGRSSVGSVSARDPKVRIGAIAGQCMHSLRRFCFHSVELLRLPAAAIRWKLALRATQRRCQLTSAGCD